MKKFFAAIMVGAAIMTAVTTVSAERIVTFDQNATLETPNNSWYVVKDPYTTITLTNDDDLVTVMSYASDAELPMPIIKSEGFKEVYQTYYTTKDRIYLITGLAVDKESVEEVRFVVQSFTLVEHKEQETPKKETSHQENKTDKTDRTEFVSESVEQDSSCFDDAIFEEDFAKVDPSEDPEEDPDKDPSKDPEDDPEKDPSEDPGVTPPDDPGKDPEKDPSEDPGQEPGVTPPDDPGEDPGQEPGVTPPDDPGVDPGVTPPVDPGVTPPIIPPDDPGVNPGKPGNAGTGDAGGIIEPDDGPSGLTGRARRIVDGNGAVISIDERNDGRWIDENGRLYINNGDGTWTNLSNGNTYYTP